MAPERLRLLAHDPEGLTVISAACQDALVRRSDMRFDPGSRSFGFEMNRFCWERTSRPRPFWRPPEFARMRSIIAFNGVQRVQSRTGTQDAEPVQSLLSIAFIPAEEPPAGAVTLTFAGGDDIRLTVECLEVSLLDIGPEWPTRRRPRHQRRAP